MNENEIEQIRRAHASARPNPSENPAFANTHRDLGICLRYIEQLEVKRNSAFKEASEIARKWGDECFLEHNEDGGFASHHIARAIRWKRQEGHHIDDQGVDKLSEAMKVKLKQKRSDGRRGWQNKSECTAEDLSSMLRDHVEKGDPVDVANFCMMLHYRGDRIE